MTHTPNALENVEAQLTESLDNTWQDQSRKVEVENALATLRAYMAAQAPIVGGDVKEALGAFKRVRVFCDASTENIAPFLVDLKRRLDVDLDAVESALTAPA